MTGKHPRRLSFAALDREKGVPEPGPASGDEYPLAAWYRSIREVPLEQLGIEDVAKAARQQVHLEHVVPLALHLLEADPVAGEMYDGELLVSLKPVPQDYWSENQAERLALKSVAESALRQESLTPDVREEVKELLRKI